MLFINFGYSFGFKNASSKQKIRLLCTRAHSRLPNKIVGHIEVQYKAFTYRVLHNGTLSNPIWVVAGVRQGCEIDRGLWQPITMEHLNNFNLADDVSLLAQRRSDMQSRMDDLAVPLRRV